MTKEEKIKEAWGEYYELVKNELDEHGRYSYYDDNSIKRKSKLWQFENIETHQISNLNLLIPSSIKGIENNNGWIKIESQADLPKLTIEYYVLKNGSLTTAYYRGNNRWVIPENDFPKTTEIHKITHYQPIEKPKPPIY